MHIAILEDDPDQRALPAFWVGGTGHTTCGPAAGATSRAELEAQLRADQMEGLNTAPLVFSRKSPVGWSISVTNRT